MPNRKHLGRLENVYLPNPVFFITTGTFRRSRILASNRMHEIAIEVWGSLETRHGWIVGRYVLMPDHVHFFCSPRRDLKRLRTFVGKWKEWTAKHAYRRMNIKTPFWQAEFFDHALRSSESFDEKWHYIRDNPVRAKLVSRSDDWPYQGQLHDLWHDT